MSEPADRLSRHLFPRLRPFWQEFWTGMLLGTLYALIMAGLIAVWWWMT